VVKVAKKYDKKMTNQGLAGSSIEGYIPIQMEYDSVDTLINFFEWISIKLFDSIW
jgi:hypothetical protein